MSLPELVSASSVGIDARRLDVLCRRVRLEVDGGPLPSAQIAVAKAGRLVHFETIGNARPEDRYILQSVGRSVVAGVVWKLIGEGLLSTDERVADIIPEFSPNGKESVTVHHVLTHTAGFPFAPLGFPKMTDRARRLEAFSRWRLTFAPGSQFQYHLTSAAWVIAELVERRTGSTFAEYLRAEIAEPLGLSLEVGVPVDRQKDTIAWPQATDRTSDDQQVDPWGPWYLVDPAILAAGEPSHSMVGTAADLALFFQALRHSGRWDANAVAECSRIHHSMAPVGEQLYGGHDEITHMALFVTVSGDSPGQWMPATSSPATFGSGGAPSQIAFYDPESDLSFAYLTNGYPMTGYDYTRRGVSTKMLIMNLAGDLAN
jgi:CubicO group peptidase (beta-lactamase class C family)